MFDFDRLGLFVYLGNIMSNPIIARTELVASSTPMSVKGVVTKTAFLLSLSAISGFGLFFYALMSNLSSSLLYTFAIGGMIAGVVLGLVSAFKPHLAKAVAVPYALAEGLLLGGISAIFFRIYPSVPLTALSATFVTASIMLGLYATGVVKVTEKFRSVVMSAVFAIMVLYLVQWGFRIFGSTLPFLFSGGLVAIGFSLFVVVIASLSLLIDFDNVEQGVHYGADERFEWVHSMGILSTLVWMYLEILRLLGYLQDD